MSKKTISRIAVCALTLASSVATAHVNIARENVFALGDGPREYLEGKSAFINLNLPHSCANADHTQEFATTDVVVVLPNSVGLDQMEFYTKDRSGNMHGANAVMGVKQRVSRNWRKTKVVKGTVPAYYAHGMRTEDARALKWLRGHVDNDHYDNLEFKTSLPKIDPNSCIGKLRVEVPAVQYCQQGYVTAWIGTTGSANFPADSAKLRLEETYEPYFNVVRDVANNPYPATCPVDGSGNVIPETRIIRPTDADIDAFSDRHL